MQINQSAHTTFIFCCYVLGFWQLKTAVTPTLATKRGKGWAPAKDYLQKGVVAQCTGQGEVVAQLEQWPGAKHHHTSSDSDPF